MALSISFIIPTYNAAGHIERCLKSIRGQDYPQEQVEVIISDGGSTDKTLDIANRYNCRIYHNPKRLAEYGLQSGVINASGELLVPFAADNELIGADWLRRITGIFSKYEDISAVWGRLASGIKDRSLNKYFELIQSDPLSWFLNKNLEKYLARPEIREGDCFIFRVKPNLPLVWGANGLVYKKERIKSIWEQKGYLGDNDAFHYMVSQGNNRVAYLDRPHVYHHHVITLLDWVKKWKRNYRLHFLANLKTRNISWVFVPDFNLKLALWVVYSLCPLLSGLHAFTLIVRNRNRYWVYHPLASFLQTAAYGYITLTTKNGRGLLNSIVFGRFSNKQ